LHNYEHKKVIEEIAKLNDVPTDTQRFSEWIQAEGHLDFLRQNACAENVVVYASGALTFIHTVVVPNDKLLPVDKEDLLRWSLNPYTSLASYVMGGGCEAVWIERGLSGSGSKTLEGAGQLIFGRTFEGWSGPGKDYYEVNQEYTHLTSIHWRPESRAYCRFDQRGDLEPVVSVTTREDKGNIALVSFKWKPLEEYLAASNASLVRMFDFTLFRRAGFSGWPREAPELFEDSEHLFYWRMVVPGHAGYARGIQIVRPRRPNNVVFAGIKDGWRGRSKNNYLEFVAYDWRNDRIAKISTDPSATANYFNGNGNSLPFELSPAFFKPEVLLKYKTDRDKYTVGERDVSCRAAWHLEGIDVNEAGQVHAYICYLRRLPYEEQLHWLSFNEEPKANISKRAVKNDFEGEWVAITEPLTKILSILRHWQEDKVAWWSVRDEKLFKRVNTPLTSSRDEWAEAFMELAKLVIEGFETQTIRAKLDEIKAQYDKQEKTIALLEKLLGQAKFSGEPQRLDGLRTVQLLRSKAKGHVGGTEADQLALDASAEHETFTNHFRHVCTQVPSELEMIQSFFT
jgi:hypothetical protein